jgi:single-strand DNA-binding protein
MYLNEIKLIGFVGQDSELKGSQNSKELVRFDVATKASWKNRDSGEYDDSRSEWHRIVVWGSLTKFAQTLKKGEHVYVSGELRYRHYEKAVGEGKKTVTMPVAQIQAVEIRLLDPRTSEDGAA